MTPHLLDDWIIQSIGIHSRYYFVIMFAFSSILVFCRCTAWHIIMLGKWQIFISVANDKCRFKYCEIVQILRFKSELRMNIHFGLS